MKRALGALAPLALLLAAAGPARAGLITYDFTGNSIPPGTTISGSFQVDSTVIPPSGVLTASDLQSPLFLLSNGEQFNMFNASSTLTVNPTTDDVTAANLTLTSADTTDVLQIKGSATTGFNWAVIGENPVNGIGTFTHTGGMAVPEPASLTLLGTAVCAGLGYFGWRRRKPAAA